MRKLEDLFEEAARIAEKMPDRLQESAFNRALDALLQQEEQGKVHETPHGKSSVSGNARVSEAGEESIEDRARYLTQNLDSTEHPEIHQVTSVLSRSLHVLKIARDKFAIDGLTTSEVVAVLKDKFRIKVSARGVRGALSEAGNLVDRVPEGRGYRYRIMKPGEEHLSGAGSSTNPPSRSKRPKKSAGNSAQKADSSRTTSKAAGSGTERKTRSATASGRGPMEWVRGLIQERWFSEPRSINDILAELERRGASYKRTDLTRQLLSLVRDEELTRQKRKPSDGGRVAWHYEN